MAAVRYLVHDVDAVLPFYAALGFAHFPDAAFEHPDGSVLRADVDLVGTVKSRDGSYPAGPLADLRAGLGRVRVW